MSERVINLVTVSLSHQKFTHMISQSLKGARSVLSFTNSSEVWWLTTVKWADVCLSQNLTAIFQATFITAFSWEQSFVFWFKYHSSSFVRVQLGICQGHVIPCHLFSTEPLLKPDIYIYMKWEYSWITSLIPTLIARFMGPTWGPSGADRTQVGPMLAPWTLLSGKTTDVLNHCVASPSASMILTMQNKQVLFF